MRIVCVICTEIFVINAHISVVPCGHVFHEECLFRWFKASKLSCPECRCKVVEKNVVRRLFLNESTDSIGLDHHSPLKESSDGVSKDKYITLLNTYEACKNELKEQRDNLKQKSELIEKKEKCVKDLDAQVATLTKNNQENRLLIDYLKSELESVQRLKDSNVKNEKQIQELQSKLRLTRNIELIHSDDHEKFVNEMKKYLNEESTNAAHLSSIVKQLVKVNVILKEYHDKHSGEKRLLRKKLAHLEKIQLEKDKFMQTKEAELESMRKQLDTLDVREKQIDLLKQKYETMSRLYERQTQRLRLLESKNDTKDKENRRLSSESHIIGDEHQQQQQQKEKHQPQLVINDTLSPVHLSSTTNDAQLNLSERDLNDNSRIHQRLDLFGQLKATSKHIGQSSDDSDIEFIHEIDRLESNLDRKRAANGMPRNSIELIEIGEQNEAASTSKTSATTSKNSSLLLLGSSDCDLPEFSPPVPKRAKNPFMLSTDQGVEASSSSKDVAKLSLSQRILNSSTPDMPMRHIDEVPIARPITSNEHGRLKTLNESSSTSKLKSATTSSGTTYAYDGLGGRSKLYKLSSASNLKTYFTTSSSSSSASNTKSKPFGKSRSSFAPIAVSSSSLKSTNGLIKNKSSNLCKSKVSDLANFFK